MFPPFAKRSPPYNGSAIQSGRDRQFDIMLVAGLAAFGITYVGFALTPSHFAQTLTLLGFSDTGLLFGEARAIRSDDYLVATSLLRTAVMNGFREINALPPYHESLKSFIALPLWDW